MIGYYCYAWLRMRAVFLLMDKTINDNNIFLRPVSTMGPHNYLSLLRIFPTTTLFLNYVPHKISIKIYSWLLIFVVPLFVNLPLRSQKSYPHAAQGKQLIIWLHAHSMLWVSLLLSWFFPFEACWLWNRHVIQHLCWLFGILYLAFHCSKVS